MKKTWRLSFHNSAQWGKINRQLQCSCWAVWDSCVGSQGNVSMQQSISPGPRLQMNRAPVGLCHILGPSDPSTACIHSGLFKFWIGFVTLTHLLSQQVCLRAYFISIWGQCVVIWSGHLQSLHDRYETDTRRCIGWFFKNVWLPWKILWYFLKKQRISRWASNSTPRYTPPKAENRQTLIHESS